MRKGSFKNLIMMISLWLSSLAIVAVSVLMFSSLTVLYRVDATAEYRDLDGKVVKVDNITDYNVEKYTGVTTFLLKDRTTLVVPTNRIEYIKAK